MTKYKKSWSKKYSLLRSKTNILKKMIGTYDSSTLIVTYDTAHTYFIIMKIAGNGEVIWAYDLGRYPEGSIDILDASQISDYYFVGITYKNTFQIFKINSVDGSLLMNKKYENSQINMAYTDITLAINRSKIGINIFLTQKSSQETEGISAIINSFTKISMNYSGMVYLVKTYSRINGKTGQYGDLNITNVRNYKDGSSIMLAGNYIRRGLAEPDNPKGFIAKINKDDDIKYSYLISGVDNIKNIYETGFDTPTMIIAGDTTNNNTNNLYVASINEDDSKLEYATTVLNWSTDIYSESKASNFIIYDHNHYIILTSTLKNPYNTYCKSTQLFRIMLTPKNKTYTFGSIDYQREIGFMDNKNFYVNAIGYSADNHGAMLGGITASEIDDSCEIIVCKLDKNLQLNWLDSAKAYLREIKPPNDVSNNNKLVIIKVDFKESQDIPNETEPRTVYNDVSNDVKATDLA